MTEEEFKERFARDTPSLKAWGGEVIRVITNRLRARELIVEEKHPFFQIEPSPRVKQIDSALDKAFVRKRYSNPYDDLTDKVGVRFVVLLSGDISQVAQAIEAVSEWEWSKDRDYEEERAKRPEVFTYQSVHYVVRPRSALRAAGVEVYAHLPCEIQVRTILQHAYAELDHRTSYKPLTATNDPQMKRLLARSVALIEAADDHFDRVNKIMAPILEVPKMTMMNLAVMYRELLALEPDEAGKSAYEILDAMAPADDLSIDKLREFISANRFIVDQVKVRAVSHALFRNPAILFVYWLAKTKSATTKAHWPLPESLLRPIYSDLGIAFS